MPLQAIQTSRSSLEMTIGDLKISFHLMLLLWQSFPCRYEAAFISNLAGPFEVRFNRLEVCPKELDGLGLLNYTTRVRRDRQDPKIFFYTGVISYFFHISQDIGVVIRMSSWSSRGGWLENAFSQAFPKICQMVMKYDPERVKKYSTFVFGSPRICPLPPAELTFKDLQIDVSPGVQFRHFFYGKWRLDMQILSERIVLGCYRIFIDTVPLVEGHKMRDPSDNLTGSITYRLIPAKFKAKTH